MLYYDFNIEKDSYLHGAYKRLREIMTKLENEMITEHSFNKAEFQDFVVMQQCHLMTDVQIAQLPAVTKNIVQLYEEEDIEYICIQLSETFNIRTFMFRRKEHELFYFLNELIGHENTMAYEKAGIYKQLEYAQMAMNLATDPMHQTIIGNEVDRQALLVDTVNRLQAIAEEVKQYQKAIVRNKTATEFAKEQALHYFSRLRHVADIEDKLNLN